MNPAISIYTVRNVSGWKLEYFIHHTTQYNWNRHLPLPLLIAKLLMKDWKKGNSTMNSNIMLGEIFST